MKPRYPIFIYAGVLLAAPSAAAPPVAVAPKLDLKPPDITTIFTSVEIARLARLSDAEVEEVRVEASRPTAGSPHDLPAGWDVIAWLVSPRNTSTAPDATGANATVSRPPPFAGQGQPYDR